MSEDMSLRGKLTTLSSTSKAILGASASAALHRAIEDAKPPPDPRVDAAVRGSATHAFLLALERWDDGNQLGAELWMVYGCRHSDPVALALLRTAYAAGWFPAPDSEVAEFLARPVMLH